MGLDNEPMPTGDEALLGGHQLQSHVAGPRATSICLIACFAGRDGKSENVGPCYETSEERVPTLVPIHPTMGRSSPEQRKAAETRWVPILRSMSHGANWDVTGTAQVSWSYHVRRRLGLKRPHGGWPMKAAEGLLSSRISSVSLTGPSHLLRPPCANDCDTHAQAPHFHDRQ